MIIDNSLNAIKGVDYLEFVNRISEKETERLKPHNNESDR